jgi:hypothetical protein
MDDVTLSIDTREWENLLKALPEKTRRGAVRQALQRAGDVMADAIAEEAPERTDTPTPDSNSLPPGILKADISSQVQLKAKLPPRVKVGATEIASRVAWWIEQGFDHKRGNVHVDANPFMARGFERSITAATTVFLDSLSTALTADVNATGGSGTSGEEI